MRGKAVKVPEGYESVGEEPAFDDSEAPTALSVPDGYARPKKRMLQGREKLCHSCFRKGIEVVDTCCPGCIESLKQLGRIRVEIGQRYEKALELSLPALMLGLYKALVKEREKVASLKAAQGANPAAPKTFEEAWAEKERQGYQYGKDALEQVRFGWKIARGEK